MADNLDTIFPDLDTSDEQDPLGLSVDAKDDTYNSNCQQGTSCLQSHILGTSLEESDMLGTSLQDVENKSHDHTRDADVYDFQTDSDFEENLYIVTSTPLKKTKDPKDRPNEGNLYMHELPSPFKDTTSESSNQNSGTDEATCSLASTDDSGKTEKTEAKIMKNTRLKKAIATAADAKKMSTKECLDKCLETLGLSEVKAARLKYWTKSPKERTEWMMDKIEESAKINGKKFFSIFHGKSACMKCFCLLYNISKTVYYKNQNKMQSGRTSSGIKKQRRRSEPQIEAHSWLNHYSTCFGDKMPDRDEIFLPYKFRKRAVYEKYSYEKTQKMKQPVALSSFMRMWKKDFRWLKIKKTNAFSKCDKCTALERQLEGTRDSKERASIRELIDAHNNRQMEERQYYYNKREQSKQFPDDYLSIIIDGMDQSKTNLPHFTGRKAKSLEATYILKTHVQGVINHGQNRFFPFIDINEYCHDANLVVNTVLKVLKESIGKKGTLPGTFYIQADNCFRENKNKYVLAFCELLIRMKIFAEVHLSFLYVGHTHEDIDAQFSHLAGILKTNDAVTLPRLLALFPNAVQLRGLYNFKEWVEPYLNEIQHHSKPLHFLFRKARDEDVEVCYKGQNNAAWLLLPTSILTGIPEGRPAILKPESMHKIDSKLLQKTIEKCCHLFQEPSSKTWWTGYINEIENVNTDQTSMNAYAEVNAEWVMEVLPKQKPQDTNDKTVPDKILEMLDQEMDVPNVTIKNRTRRGTNQRTTQK